MSAWTDDNLTRIGGAEELQIASRPPDGTLHPYVTIWGHPREGRPVCAQRLRLEQSLVPAHQGERRRRHPRQRH
jgi:hypothetical protein